MENKIKWTRLKNTLQTYLGESVNIICTTEFKDTPNTVFGFVGKDGSGNYRIVININEAKDVETVIDVLAHESAHIVTKSRRHDDEHDKETDKIRQVLKDGYIKKNEGSA